ncbi:aldehyde dehydrogenase (NADP(+)) [Enterovirga sp.]|uniref:aldehyde dehydrogenase (NADP(+)) n=1 Tax=Enterovirga sp. TaxID=2026350 RepID=UPI002D0F889E|nr:aldehyde dehydrogenase (NADP(+)) [Enterovirga sp.]HMO30698.1 aldehyde dehydrogenase (NADP(+)) [Enterovirga sp.]
MMVTGDILLGGQRVAGGQRSFHAINPATGETLEPAFAFAGPAEVERACDLAWAAFPVYRATGLEERARFLETIAANILELGDALVERACAETGLPRGRIEGERGRTIGQLKLFAEVVRQGEWMDLRIDPALPDRKPLPRPDLRLRNIPLGPVAVFGASNFPLAFSVAGGDTASALAAGCPVVVKGHPAHPGTGELVGRAVQAAVASCGLPEGVFSLLLGEVETGSALVAHPHIKAVGFTGSRGGGVALGRIAAARAEPIPVYAEMSSINPVYLLPEALAARAEALGREFVGSLTMGAGQFCTNPGLVFAIEGEGLDRFVAAASEALGASAPQPMLTPGIHKAYEAGVKALAEHERVKTLARGQVGEGIAQGSGALFATDADSFASDERLGHEVFGSSSLVVRCRDAEALVTLSERLEGQLTATLQMELADAPLARRLTEVLELKAGRILANGWPTGVEVAHAMVHGGPYPATSDSRTTSVGTLAIRRFLRPVCYQNLLPDLLPPELRDGTKLPRLVDGARAR